MQVVHKWLEDYLGDALPSAKKTEELLAFHAFEVEGVEEVEGETVIDVDILPNRSSDCLSHRGIARELATILDTDLKKDPLQEKIDIGSGSKINLDITDPSLCSRFTAAVITGVKVKESPKWLQQRLKALGQRPINNIVDATNYVMYAIGQPTHALDLDKMGKDSEGRANITIRNGREGESLTLLTGEEIQSDENVLHLVDGNSGALLDLAGIKGGAAAELTDKTKNIVVTSGNFNYQSVRKTSQRLKVATDASQRFQNQPSPELAGYGLAETVKLILELAGGDCDGMVDVYPAKPKTVSADINVETTNKLLGLELSKSEIADILKRVAGDVTETKTGFTVTAPWERTDLNIEADYIEEVGRIHGLSNIESVVPEAVPLTEVNPRQYYGDKIRAALMQVGFSEVITSSFQKKAKIQLQNALASDKSYVRKTLVKNITGVLDANFNNLDFLGVTDVRVFEIGTVFEKTDKGVGEYVALTLGARTKGDGYNPKDDKVLEEGCLAVAKALGTKPQWQIEKGVAEMNLSEVIEALPVPDAYDPLPESESVTYKPFSSFPAVSRDIALWVGEKETPESVLEALTEAAGDMCVRQSLFDTFSKDGRTSYAFRLVFQSNVKTLTDVEVNKIMDKLYEVAKKKEWEVR